MTVKVTGGGGMSLKFDPARGAKVTSLRAGGIEWLAQRDVDDPPTGTAFMDAEMAGWDECAPSIVACTLGEYEIPDHGDLWDRPFEMIGTIARATGSSLPYVLERKIEKTERGVRFAYRATASSVDIPFLWAAHPQFLAPPGTRVELSGVSAVVDVMAPGEPEMAWTAGLGAIDSGEPGGCRKLYVHPRRGIHSAILMRPEGALELTWSSAAPYLGLWFDRGVYRGTDVLAIEPSTGYFDSLDRAARSGRVLTLRPGEWSEWWLDLAVRPNLPQ